MADIMNKLSFNFLYNGAPLNFNEIKKRTNETVINAGLKRAKKLAGSDETRNNELNSFINNPNPAIKINGLGAFLRKYGNAQDFNYGALLRSLTNTEFNEALFNNKNVAKLIKRDELYQTTDYEELGGYLDETSTEGDENSIDDGIDLMTQLWNLSIGEVKDFNKHVEEVIKYHLASLPKLTAASLCFASSEVSPAGGSGAFSPLPSGSGVSWVCGTILSPPSSVPKLPPFSICGLIGSAFFFGAATVPTIVQPMFKAANS
jgi:hypothetical protein